MCPPPRPPSFSLSLPSSFPYFESGPYSEAQAGLELTVWPKMLLNLYARDYGHELPCPTWLLHFWATIIDFSIFNSPDDGVDTQSGTKKEDLNDKEKKEEEETPAPVLRAKSILESWVWGKQPGITLFDSSGSSFCLLMEFSKIKTCITVKYFCYKV